MRDRIRLIRRVTLHRGAIIPRPAAVPQASKRVPRALPVGLHKQLRKPYHEAGVDRDLRVVIAREGDKGIAVLAGNHDQIRRFLAGA